jgi:hypothetical protein
MSCRRRLLPRHLASRQLRIELLEDRRMLTTITVTTLQDQNNGSTGGMSLREAIASAGVNDTINFLPSLTSGGPAVLTLTRGELFIDNRITIQGPGANLLTIDASGNDPTPLADNGDGSRVFRIEHTITLAPLRVTISGLKLAGGDVGSTNHGGTGGAIWNNQNLTLSNVIVAGNAASVRAGGIHHEASQATEQNHLMTKLTLLNSTVTDNVAGQSGGGVVIHGAGDITNSTISSNHAGAGGGIYFVTAFTTDSKFNISSSLFSGNQAAGEGGGIYNNGGLLGVTDSTFSANIASAGLGGGIFNNSNFSLMNISGSTFTENVGLIGGGIYNAGTANIVNSTISGNMSSHESVLAAGMRNDGLLTLFGSTIAYNRPLDPGTIADSLAGVGLETGGEGGGTSVLIQNIIAENTQYGGADVIGYEGSVDPSSAYNLVGNVNGTFPALDDQVNGNIVGEDIAVIHPNLGPLAFNGGPTKTHALLPGSPAINAGDPNLMPGIGGVPTYDQRGAPYARVSGGRADIGAYEVQGAATPSADFNLDGRVNGADFLLWQRGLGAAGASATRAKGNADLDSDVDAADLAIWKATFGSSGVASSSSEAVADELTAAALTAEPGSRINYADAIDAAITYQQMLDASSTRPLFRPRMMRSR